MSKRRGNGEGTINKRKDGRWQAVVTVGYDSKTGKIRRRSFYGKTRKEAVGKMNQALKDLSAGSYVEPHKITLGEWLDRWLHDYKKGSLRSNTWEGYKTLIDTHIKPALGWAQLSKVQGAMLQHFYNEKLTGGRKDGKGGLSTRYVRYMHSIIRSALQQAVIDNLISRNAADSTTPPTVKTKDMEPLSENQVQQFLATVEKDRLYPAYTLAVATGMRRGELLGLKWDCIDLVNGFVTVRRQLLSSNSGPMLEEDLKTKSSRRSIPISANIVRLLKSHKSTQAQEKLLLGDAYQDQGLVFAREDGAPLEPREFTKRFQRLLEKAGLPQARFHDLRHTHASLLLAKGVHPKVVQERLGHSSITMTLDLYSHVAQGLQEQAAQKLDNLFEEKEKGPLQREGQ